MNNHVLETIKASATQEPLTVAALNATAKYQVVDLTTYKDGEWVVAKESEKIKSRFNKGLAIWSNRFH